MQAFHKKYVLLSGIFALVAVLGVLPISRAYIDPGGGGSAPHYYVTSYSPDYGCHFGNQPLSYMNVPNEGLTCNFWGTLVSGVGIHHFFLYMTQVSATNLALIVDANVIYSIAVVYTDGNSNSFSVYDGYNNFALQSSKVVDFISFNAVVPFYWPFIHIDYCAIY